MPQVSNLPSGALAAVLALLLTTGRVALAQGSIASDPKATPTMNPNRPVVATALGDSMNRVGDPVFVTITLLNTAATEQIVKNLTAKVDGSADARLISGGECALGGMGEITLSPGETFSQTCRFPVASTSMAASKDAVKTTQEDTGWSPGKWYSRLFSADLRLIIDVNVEGVGSRRFFPVISVKSSETSIFIGGVVGAMLLALFVWAERLLKNPEVRERWGRSLLVTLLMGFRGGLLAVIALLLGKTTQGAGSPVTLTVVDFAGGVLIGLFSYPLASWISSTLKLDGVFVPAGQKEIASRDDSTKGVDK